MFTVITAAIFGLMVGSAINAVVWRLYTGRSWAKGRSMCPECKHQLAAKDLVPVLSWLWLWGRCRYCQTNIHWQYPVIEALTAGLFSLSVQALAPAGPVSWGLAGLWLLILTLLIILAVYDARWMLLPDKIMVPVILLSGIYLVLHAWQQGSWISLRGPLLAALLMGGIFFALVALSKGRAMGGGDIKLVFAMGLLLGLRGSAVALFIAFNVAALVGITLMVFKRRGRRDQIAFGPFLVGATVVAFLYGQDVVQWYLALNGLS